MNWTKLYMLVSHRHTAYNIHYYYHDDPNTHRLIIFVMVDLIICFSQKFWQQQKHSYYTRHRDYRRRPVETSGMSFFITTNVIIITLIKY